MAARRPRSSGRQCLGGTPLSREKLAVAGALAASRLSPAGGGSEEVRNATGAAGGTVGETGRGLRSGQVRSAGANVCVGGWGRDKDRIGASDSRGGEGDEKGTGDGEDRGLGEAWVEMGYREEDGERGGSEEGQAASGAV